MKIQVIKVELEKTPKYEMLNVTYKNLSQGKVESRKIPSFKNPDVFSTLKGAVDGNVFEVELVKDGQYWQWTKITASSESAPSASSAPASAGGTAYRPTYETPEERAKRQVYITRAASINAAIELLSVGAKSPPDIDQVLATAVRFEHHVLGNDPVKALLEMESDLPDVKV